MSKSKGLAVVPKKIDKNTVYVEYNNKLIAIIRGEELETKTIEKRTKQVQDSNGF